MICKNCGKEIPENLNKCPSCNTEIAISDKKTFYPSFILGLIGGIFGILGGLCVFLCYGTSMFSQGQRIGSAVLFFIVGGSIVGLVGACKSLSNLKKGSIMEIIAGLAILICIFISGSDLMTILALILFLVGGIMGVLTSIKK